MFAKGPPPGASPKLEALAVLPPGVTCARETGYGVTGYVVRLANGKGIASAGSAQKAWEQAHAWAIRNPEQASATPPV